MGERKLEFQSSDDGLYVNGLFNYGQYNEGFSFGTYYKDTPHSQEDLIAFINNDIPVFLVKAVIIFNQHAWLSAPLFKQKYPHNIELQNLGSNINSLEYYNLLNGPYIKSDTHLAFIDIKEIIFSFNGSKNISLPREPMVVFFGVNDVPQVAGFSLGVVITKPKFYHSDINQRFTDAVDNKIPLYMTIYFDKDSKFRLVRSGISDAEAERLLLKYNSYYRSRL